MQQGTRALRALPTSRTDSEDVPRACKRPLCGRVVAQPSGRSRPRDFCSDTCRLTYRRERNKVASALLEAQRLAVQYGVDTGEYRTRAPGVPRESTANQEYPTRAAGVLRESTASQLPSPAEVALALIAQCLESVRIDLQDGMQLSPEDVLTRLIRVKDQGDRFLRTQR